jgi:hypothetical protein
MRRDYAKVFIQNSYYKEAIPKAEKKAPGMGQIIHLLI